MICPIEIMARSLMLEATVRRWPTMTREMCGRVSIHMAMLYPPRIQDLTQSLRAIEAVVLAHAAARRFCIISEKAGSNVKNDESASVLNAIGKLPSVRNVSLDVVEQLQSAYVLADVKPPNEFVEDVAMVTCKWESLLGRELAQHVRSSTIAFDRIALTSKFRKTILPIRRSEGAKFQLGSVLNEVLKKLATCSREEIVDVQRCLFGASFMSVPLIDLVVRIVYARTLHGEGAELIYAPFVLAHRNEKLAGMPDMHIANLASQPSSWVTPAHLRDGLQKRMLAVALHRIRKLSIEHLDLLALGLSRRPVKERNEMMPIIRDASLMRLHRVGVDDDYFDDGGLARSAKVREKDRGHYPNLFPLLELLYTLNRSGFCSAELVDTAARVVHATLRYDSRVSTPQTMPLKAVFNLLNLFAKLCPHNRLFFESMYAILTPAVYRIKEHPEFLVHLLELAAGLQVPLHIRSFLNEAVFHLERRRFDLRPVNLARALSALKILDEPHFDLLMPLLGKCSVMFSCAVLRRLDPHTLSVVLRLYSSIDKARAIQARLATVIHDNSTSLTDLQREALTRILANREYMHSDQMAALFPCNSAETESPIDLDGTRAKRYHRRVRNALARRMWPADDDDGSLPRRQKKQLVHPRAERSR